MTNYKEIVTKAVIGKSKRISHGEYNLICEEKPNTVLGCWVINHSFSGSSENEKVIINGSFDINVWYSYDNDTKTKVSTQRYNYSDVMPVTLKDDNTLDNNSEVIVRSLKQPTVTDVKIENDKVIMNVEKELGVEIIGDTKIRVTAVDDEDEYEIIGEDNIEEVNEEYLES